MSLRNLFIVLFCLVTTQSFAQQDTIRQDLAVSAQANVYYHHIINIDKVSGGAGIEPIAIDVRGIRKITFENASGKVSCFAGDSTLNGADGGKYNLQTSVSGAGALWGIQHDNKVMFVCGVFTSYAAGLDEPYPPYNYTHQEDNKSYTLALNQTFFIGDGQTKNGITQTFYVPSEAETLYIGFADCLEGDPSNYADNHGEIKITIVLYPRNKG